MKPFSIPIPSNDMEKNLVDLVDKIFTQKNNSSENIENEIDELVYKLYGITDEEKAIIESSI